MVQSFIFACLISTMPSHALTSLMVQTVKHLPTVPETWVQSLGRKDLLKKEMATHSSILAWKIPWMEEPGRLQSMGSQRVGYDFTFTITFSSPNESFQLLEETCSPFCFSAFQATKMPFPRSKD